MMLLLAGLTSTAESQEATVTVPGTASGGFSTSDVVGFTPLVEGFTFLEATTVLIGASTPDGIELCTSFVADTPDGTVCPLLSVGCTCPFPLEEAVAELEVPPLEIPVDPPHFDVGALMGAFVTEGIVNTPGFAPLDEDRTGANPGILSTSLFLIGSGPFEFSAPGPGTLFLGINDCFSSNNVGEYFVTIQTQVTVTIDIKPGSDPNSINCNNSLKVITVAILTTEDFDATTVDHTTVTFEGASETHANRRTGEPRRHEEDVDDDGDTDLVFHFRLRDTVLDCSSTEGILSGDTFDGTPVEGTDDVNTTPKGPKVITVGEPL